jgi:PAS domain S-box-containing protein
MNPEPCRSELLDRIAALEIRLATEGERVEKASRESEQLLSVFNTIRDVIFQLTVEPEDQFRFVSVNAAFLRVTGLSREMVVGKTVNEVIPEPSLTMVLGKYRQAIENNVVVSWEETSDYPAGRLTGEVSVAPVFDDKGSCTHLVGLVHDITERKRAETALRESEERFRTVADTAPVMIWMSGLDQSCIFFNKAWLEFRGRTMEQEIGAGWVEGVHPDDVDHCLATYSASFHARRAFQMEYRLRRADGEYRWVLDNGTTRYREGQFAGYIGSCTDVTEQKLLQEQLRRKQARLLHSQRLAHVGSWELDVATGRLRWSDEMYRIYGLPNDTRPDFEMFLNRVHPKDRGIIAEAQSKAVLTDAPFSVQFRITKPNGDMRFIRSTLEAIKNDNGALFRLAGAAQDVTEQVKATELLRESEARLKSAERMAHVGNWTWDIVANRVSWSEELFRIMGQQQDHEPGYEKALQMVAPEDRGRVEQWVRDCLDEKRGSPIEVRIVRPIGDMRTVVCTPEVILDEDGSPGHLFVACQDVTDDRRAQEEWFANQNLEGLETLASGVAHDFNNLLGAVLARTELAMVEVAGGSHPDEELKAIRDVAIRGSEIVRQLTHYAGKESDALEPVDLSEVIQGMLALLNASVSRHAVLVIDLAKALPPVQARAAQVSQVVMNLVVNVSESIGDREGVIRVTATHVKVGGLEAIGNTLSAGDYVQLEVSDSGRGISSETQAKMSYPFFSRKFSGRGLGLAVVHGIVRNLRGAIRVLSEPEKGTRFQVLLPCAEAGAKPVAGRLSPAEQFAPPPRAAAVLIVEHEEQLRHAVAKMLRKAGLQAFGAESACTAVDFLRARPGKIDLILLDLIIPASSSRQVVAEAALTQPHAKVIATSDYSEEVTRLLIRSPLVCGFIRKPFQLDELVQTLWTALFS